MSDNNDAGLALGFLHQTLGASGGELFDKTVRGLSETLGLRAAFITRISAQTIETVSAWIDGKKVENFKVRLAGTPCEQVMARAKNLYFDDVCRCFPHAPYLAEISPYCYMGTPIVGCGGSPGTVVLMADHAIDDIVTVKRLLEIVAQRVAIEFSQQDLAARVRASELRAEQSFEKSLDPLFIHDLRGGLLAVNDCALKVFGYSREEINRLDLKALSPDDIATRRANAEARNRVLSKGHYRFETRCNNKNDQQLACEVTCSLMTIGGEQVICSRLEDRTELLRERAELLKLSQAAKASSSVIMITDASGHIEYVNPKFTQLTGYTRQEAMGKTPRILNTGQAPMATYKKLWSTILAGGEWRGEFRNRKKNGEYYWCRNSISGIKNEGGKLTHYLAIQDDVSKEYELNERLSYQASHDLLTGLFNRHEFERRTESLLARQRTEKGTHAICFIDLDQFKVINDTCGHVAGDALLRQLGPLLQGVVRQRDTLARVGGDEFAVLMEFCSLANAERLTRDLLKALQDYRFTWGESTFRVSASIGLAEIAEDVQDLSSLLKNADAACYMAKDSGRNRVHVYCPDDLELAQRHGEMEWVSRIYRALAEDQFCLYAQTIKRLDPAVGGRHYELLLRMRDDDGRIINPGAFLPAAERYNLIVELDRWVVGETLRQLVLHPEFMENTDCVAINLSGQTLTDAAFLEFVLTSLEKSAIKGEKICFEITETAAIANLNIAKKFIEALKSIGCKFALDDFGSGLSSFGYLKNLAVDYLKIDGMFVKEMADDPISHAMVKSINEIGQVMGIQTIAEFVENPVVEALVSKLGVNYAQGYGIEKPQPFNEVLIREND
ncbi:MAG: EAL domain-containing protein [Gammaproteobacteria bacterium]|nr:EAL domain-containing protein [Gammaproteobacteria bacterium]MBQ0838561.1 EAL domain-containing protein [Gammaproteobacteria bacterium]